MSFLKKITDKSWLKSKTLWLASVFGTIGAVLAFGQDALQYIPPDIALTITGYILLLNNGMAFILRLLTKVGLYGKKPAEGTATGVRVEPEIQGATIPIKVAEAATEVPETESVSTTGFISKGFAQLAKVDPAEVAARLAPHLLTTAQYFKHFPPNLPEHKANAEEWCRRVNGLLGYLLAKNPTLVLETNPATGNLFSGLTKGANRKSEESEGAPKSSHKIGMGGDLFDPSGDLDNLITDEILKKFDLYREDPAQTRSWAHLQIRPASRRTFFI